MFVDPAVESYDEGVGHFEGAMSSDKHGAERILHFAAGLGKAVEGGLSVATGGSSQRVTRSVDRGTDLLEDTLSVGKRQDGAPSVDDLVRGGDAGDAPGLRKIDNASDANVSHQPSAGGDVVENSASQDIITKPILSPRRKDYRKIYKEADPDLPKGWQVHHSIPQKYREMFADLGIEVDDLQFLRGVDPKIHSKITTEWGRFDKRFNGNPSPADVADFMKSVDEKYRDHLRIPGH